MTYEVQDRDGEPLFSGDIAEVVGGVDKLPVTRGSLVRVGDLAQVRRCAGDVDRGHEVHCVNDEGRCVLIWSRNLKKEPWW